MIPTKSRKNFDPSPPVPADFFVTERKAVITATVVAKLVIYWKYPTSQTRQCHSIRKTMPKIATKYCMHSKFFHSRIFRPLPRGPRGKKINPVGIPQLSDPSPWYSCNIQPHTHGKPAYSAGFPPSPSPCTSLNWTQCVCKHTHPQSAIRNLHSVDQTNAWFTPPTQTRQDCLVLLLLWTNPATSQDCFQ